MKPRLASRGSRPCRSPAASAATCRCSTWTSACSRSSTGSTSTRSPLTDIKQCGPCDLGLVEGGLCNAENVQLLRELRARCTWLVAVGACAINGGLPAQRNALDVGDVLVGVYRARKGLAPGSAVPDDPELPLPLARVHPIHEVVRVDHFLPGCPPSADAIWAFATALLDGRLPRLPRALIRYD